MLTLAANINCGWKTGKIRNGYIYCQTANKGAAKVNTSPFHQSFATIRLIGSPSIRSACKQNISFCFISLFTKSYLILVYSCFHSTFRFEFRCCSNDTDSKPKALFVTSNFQKPFKALLHFTFSASILHPIYSVCCKKVR